MDIVARLRICVDIKLGAHKLLTYKYAIIFAGI